MRFPLRDRYIDDFSWIKYVFYMKLITEKNAARKYQQGGPMAAPAAEAPAEGAAPAPEMQGQAGAEEQLAQLAGQLLEALLQQLQDPQAVMAVLEAAMQMLQESMGGGQPVFKCGGKMVKKNKKACGGNIKMKK